MNWYLIYKKEQLEKTRAIANLSPIEQVLLANRDITQKEDAQKFLHPSLSDLHDPFLMADMDVAVDYITECMYSDTPILIVGDYDQDGVAATTILMKGLGYIFEKASKDAKSLLRYAIPDRIEDGYGVNTAMLSEAISEGVGLVITCDNGISAFEAADFAYDNQLPLIITDHHQVTVKDGEEILPKAEAILNPHRKDCHYPFQDLCGAGVAYKLVEALSIRLLEERNSVQVLLQYAALGTICDMVPLVGENRVIATFGLKEMNKTKNVGLQALLDANTWRGEIDAYTVGFVIGPCINASGRLFTARLGVELFLERDEKTVREYAKELVSLNEERKAMTRRSVEKAKEMVEGRTIDDVEILYLPGIHESICGLVAGRIKDHLYHPVIVLTESQADSSILKGSGRSIEAYNMHANLAVFSDLFTSFGGHEMACGLSLAKENLSLFKEQVNAHTGLQEKDFHASLDIDLALGFLRLGYPVLDVLKRFEPYGKDNPCPLFAVKNVNLRRLRLVGKEKTIWQLRLEADGRFFNGVFFQGAQKETAWRKGLGEKKWAQIVAGEDPGLCVDLCYVPEENIYNGRTSIQLKIKDLRISQ